MNLTGYSFSKNRIFISKMITKITQANKNGEHAVEIHAL